MSPSIFAGWQDRYCILESGKFKYFKSNNAKDLQAPQGVLNMELFLITLDAIEGNGGLYFNLKFNGIDDRIFKFRTKTKQSSVTWQTEL